MDNFFLSAMQQNPNASFDIHVLRDRRRHRHGLVLGQRQPAYVLSLILAVLLAGSRCKAGW
jgi:hypothetical protein